MIYNKTNKTSLIEGIVFYLLTILIRYIDMYPFLSGFFIYIFILFGTVQISKYFFDE